MVTWQEAALRVRPIKNSRDAQHLLVFSAFSVEHQYVVDARVAMRHRRFWIYSGQLPAVD